MGFMVCGCSPVSMRVSAIMYLTKTLYQNPGFDLLPDRYVQDIRSKCGVELHSSSTLLATHTTGVDPHPACAWGDPTRCTFI
jgi:hypothetical protein